MATVGHLFAGVTDFFKGFVAKDYDRVIDNATKRFNPTAVAERRHQMVDGFRQQLSKNENLSPERIDAIVSARDSRHMIGDFFENAFGLVGAGLSGIGGTLGYSTKMATVLATKGAAIAGAGVGITGAATVAAPVAATVGAVKGARLLKGKVDDLTHDLRYKTQEMAIKAGNTPLGAAVAAVDDIAGAAPSAAAAGVGAGARWVGRGAADYGKDLGRDAWAGAKWFHQNRNSRAVTMATGVGALALMPSAYEGGQMEGAYRHKMAQVAGNMGVSNDGGGTFLRPNQAPQVNDMGATGDLVFALRSLRNGGQ